MDNLLNVSNYYLLLHEVLSTHKTPVESSACTGSMKPLSDLAKCHSCLGSCFFPVVCGLGSASCPGVQAQSYLEQVICTNQLLGMKLLTPFVHSLPQIFTHGLPHPQLLCQCTTSGSHGLLLVCCTGVVGVWIPMGHVDGVRLTSFAQQMVLSVPVVTPQE